MLVVDDDPDAHELVALTLQTAGAAIQSAPSAADALHSILRDRSDAIIADIGMPPRRRLCVDTETART